MTGYSKLFGSIVTSTIWREDKETKILWITMLALKDKNGIVEGSVPGLADMARLSIDETIKALDHLRSPDPHSRTKEHEGRRIEDVDGGWIVLNHQKYRDKMNADERREYLRVKQAEHRAKLSTNVNNGQHSSTPSTHANADTDTKAEARKKESTRCARPSLKDVVEFFGMEVLANAFWDYYESNGWRVGRNPMKDWKAAARRWQREPKPFTTPFSKTKEKPPIYDKLPLRREPTDDELAKMREIAKRESAALRAKLKPC